MNPLTKNANVLRFAVSHDETGWIVRDQQRDRILRHFPDPSAAWHYYRQLTFCHRPAICCCPSCDPAHPVNH